MYQEESVNQAIFSIKLPIRATTMPLAFAISDEILKVLANALVSSLIASGIVAWRTQRWIAAREHRGRIADRRMEPFLDIVDLSDDNDRAIAEAGSEGNTPPLNPQAKRNNIAPRLKLLASKEVVAAYDSYLALVRQESTNPVEKKPKDPTAVVKAGDDLVALMADATRTG